MTLKPSIVLLACVHSFDQVKSSMSISVSQSILQYVSLFFILQDYKNYDVYDPSTKEETDCLWVHS